MQQYANLICRTRWIGEGRAERFVIGWAGDPRWPIILPGIIVPSDYPFPLARVESRPDYQGATYVRTDVGIPLYGLLWRLWVTYLRLAVTIKSRLIYTAEVWGLAAVTPGERPSWKHLGKKHSSQFPL